MHLTQKLHPRLIINGGDYHEVFIRGFGLIVLQIAGVFSLVFCSITLNDFFVFKIFSIQNGGI